MLRFCCLLLTLLLTHLAGAQAPAPAGRTVATLAGAAGTKGHVDGPATTARFSRPMGVAVDAAGNVYVTDTDNHTIRKIAPDGQVSTLAGAAGSPGRTDGPAATARFFNPVGIALDAAGTLYVTDTGNHTIRRIGPDGQVSTLAGTPGAPGSTDGAGPAARFNQPHALAVAADGTLYVADTGNHTVRRITPAGAVSTLAGTAGAAGTEDGPGAAARFRNPYGLAVTTSGTLVVADNGNHTVRHITPEGSVTTLAGVAKRFGSTDGPGAAARLMLPSGVAAAPGGGVYVAEAGTQQVRHISPAGDVSTAAGTAFKAGATDGPAATARFKSPLGLAVAPDGALYVADGRNHTVRVIR